MTGISPGTLFHTRRSDLLILKGLSGIDLRNYVDNYVVSYVVMVL